MEQSVAAKRAADMEALYQRESPQRLPSKYAEGEWQNPFDRFDPTIHPQAAHAHQAVRDWVYGVSCGEVRGLILWSAGYGAGKTMLAKLAAECLRAMLDKDGNAQRVTFLTAPDFFQDIKDAYSKGDPVSAMFADWTRGHFILDDWGKQYTTATGEEWAREQFFHLVNAVCERRGVLITSNAKPEQMALHMGGATWSRLLGMCGPEGVVDMSNVPDYRLKRAGF